MEENIMRHASDTYDKHKDCGGLILKGNDHLYCDKCQAFLYTSDPNEEFTDEELSVMPFPAGHDVNANRSAWDDGQMLSPQE